MLSSLLRSLCSGTHELCGSTSSFAYQGTNCHAVLGTARSVPCVPAPARPWHHRRMWYQTSSHPLLARFDPTPSIAVPIASPHAPIIRIQCCLQRATFAYLNHCSQRGTAVVPTMALLEMAAAAGQLLVSREQTDNPVALVGLAVREPAALLDARDHVLLSCHINPASGNVAVGLSELSAVAASDNARARLRPFNDALCSLGQPRLRTTRRHRMLHLPGVNTFSAPVGLLFNDDNDCYWIHPAAAEASFHILTALWPSRRPLLGAVLAASAACVTMRRLRRGRTAVGAAQQSAVEPLACDTGLEGQARACFSTRNSQLKHDASYLPRTPQQRSNLTVCWRRLCTMQQEPIWCGFLLCMRPGTYTLCIHMYCVQ